MGSASARAVEPRWEPIATADRRRRRPPIPLAGVALVGVATALVTLGLLGSVARQWFDGGGDGGDGQAVVAGPTGGGSTSVPTATTAPSGSADRTTLDVTASLTNAASTSPSSPGSAESPAAVGGAKPAAETATGDDRTTGSAIAGAGDAATTSIAEPVIADSPPSSAPEDPATAEPGPTTATSRTSPATSTPTAPSTSTGSPTGPDSPAPTGDPATSRPPSTTAGPPTTDAPSTRPPTTGSTSGGSGAAPEGTVIWEDTFDRLDTSVWRLEHSTYGDGNNELQCYRPDNVAVRGGRLVLSARTETVTCPNGSTRRVSSGMIRSQGVTFSPGQAIEFRVKLTPADPQDQGGLWPAVWASSWAGGWPAGGELDFLEVMTAEDPTRAMFSMHYAGPDGRHDLQNRGVRGGENFSAAWHTIRFDYGTNGRLRWYIDGAVGFAVDAADTLQGFPAPFDQTIRELKINLALGGRPGPLSAGAVGSTGATFEVDYIRIIQL